MDLKNIVGEIDSNPVPSAYDNALEGGLTLFITNIIRVLFVVAGVVMLFNLIIAGYQYMMAAGDPKKLNQAWERIWNSLIGLVIVAGSFTIAALMGALIFGDPTFIFNPIIYGPDG